MRSSIVITTTSADGLLTTISRPNGTAGAAVAQLATEKFGVLGAVQTIARSVQDNGSYSWDNCAVLHYQQASGGGSSDPIGWDGLSKIVSAHAVDALGIEAWTMTNTWIDRVRTTHAHGSNDPTYTYSDIVSYPPEIGQ